MYDNWSDKQRGIQEKQEVQMGQRQGRNVMQDKDRNEVIFLSFTSTVKSGPDNTDITYRTNVKSPLNLHCKLC